MNISNINFNSWYHKANDNHIKRFEHFMKTNKLDNALVVTESGDVIDTFSLAIMHNDISFLPSIWAQFCRQLSKAFYFAGSVVLKAASLSSIWTRSCYKLSGLFNLMGSFVCKADHFD